MMHIRPGKTSTWSPKTLGIHTCLLCIALPTIMASASLVERADSKTQEVTEYEVKAAYVYYFAKFTEWPPEALPSPNSPITIGVIGNDEFGALLDKVVKDKTVLNHPMAVRRLNWPADLRSIQMLYIGSMANKRLKQIEQDLQKMPVLTIAETENGARTSGIVNLFIEGGKVQFDVDIKAAEKSGLRVSSKLLRMAREIRGDHSGEGPEQQ